MFNLVMAGYTAILVPLAASSLVAVAGRLFNRKVSWVLALASSLITFIASCIIYVVPAGTIYVEGPRIPLVPGVPVGLSLYIDTLSAFFSIVVGLIGLLVIIYSYSYMEDSPGYTRYYSLITLFIGSMEGLVLTGGLLELYIFWEIVGLCSFTLIAHHYYSPRASRAGIKALITTRVGDVAFLVGIVYAYLTVGSLEYPSLIRTGFQALQLPLLLLLVGVIAKSAQLPLHIWLPDAMEGPTPVSALIHAATMVKAGIYLLLRITVLALSSGGTLPISVIQLSSGIGAATALYAALSAAAQRDVKRLLAYSTMSQLGFMIAAIGSQGLTAALEHVASHAVFKALLFLAVGVLIHEHEHLFGPEKARDIHYIAGTARRSKLLAASLIVGAAALAGVPPFNGAWSKEAVIDAVLHYNILIALILLAASIVTAFYSTKLVYYLVFAESRHKNIAVRRIPLAMSLPLLILVALCFISPLLLELRLPVTEPGIKAVAASITAVLVGLLASFLLYSGKLRLGIPAGLQHMVFEGFYVDRVYMKLLAPTLFSASRLLARKLIRAVDILVSSLARFSLQLGRILSGMHLGKLSYYYTVYLIGLIMLVITVLISAGG